MRGEFLIVDRTVKETLRSTVKMNAASRNTRHLIALTQESEDKTVNYQILLGGNSWEVSILKKSTPNSDSLWLVELLVYVPNLCMYIEDKKGWYPSFRHICPRPK